MSNLESQEDASEGRHTSDSKPSGTGAPSLIESGQHHHHLSAHKGYETAKRLAKQLRATAKKLSIAEWCNVFFTAVIAIATVINLFIVNGQLKEMHDSGTDEKKIIDANVKLANAAQESAKTANDNFVATQRAWVGTTDAMLVVSPLSVGSIKGSVTYVNSGREPEKFSASADEFVYPSETWTSGRAGTSILARQQSCLHISEVPGFRFACGIRTFNMST